MFIKLEKLRKPELEEYCKNLGIDIDKKTKSELIESAYGVRRAEIDKSINEGNSLELLKETIGALSDEYALNLKEKISSRKLEMEQDDVSHYLIYRVLGISDQEGKLIDEYQNKGRFLYKYAGSFLEDAASQCLFFANSQGGKTKIDNTRGSRPKTFEIDFLNRNDAIEIKWRDATTDGDHITKEHTRIKVIESHGYKPIRIMFYYPQREQAIKIQETLKTIYDGVSGEYHAGDEAWEYIKNYTGYELKSILTEIAERREHESTEGK